MIKRTAERFGGLDGRGVGSPVTEVEIDAQLARDRPFQDYDHETTGKGAARGGDIAIRESELELVRQELEAEFQELVEGDLEIESLLAEKDQETPQVSSRGIFSPIKIIKALARIAFRVIRRHVRNRDHGFYPTIVEEILRELYLADLGAWVWGSMKDKASNIWSSNDGLIGEEQHIGSYFLEHLNTLQSERDVVVNLVGHSAGAVVISHLFDTLERYPNVSFGTIAFLAPAATSDLVVQTMLSRQDRFSAFRMYTMTDHFERNDMLVKGVYTRSLLYFIAGVLEPDMVDKPLSGMMRYASDKRPFDDDATREWTNYVRSNNRLAEADSTEVEPNAAPGFRTSSRSHGGFDNDLLTLESLTTLLKS